MRRPAFGVLFVAVSVAFGMVPAALAPAGHAASAQEGHPLTGTWVGAWGTRAGAGTRVTIVMSWDGKQVTGLMNPGPDAVPLTNVAVDWDTWTVRIEAAPKGASGTPAPAVAEGRLEDIGSARRKIVGTWRQAGAETDFTITRE